NWSGFRASSLGLPASLRRPVALGSAWLAVEPELTCDSLHCIDHELDVRGQIDAEIRGSARDVFAVHVGRKTLLLHLFLHAGGLEIHDAVRSDQGRGCDEASEFIARVK